MPENKADQKAIEVRERYNRVANSAALRDIKLVSTNYDVLPSFFTDYDDVKLQLSNSVDEVHFSKEGSFVLGVFIYNVRATLKRKRVLHCKAHFIVVYDLPEGSDEEAATAFCTRVGFFAAYPYFRALFSTVTRFGGAELPLLPVISSSSLKMVEKVKKERTRRPAASKQSKPLRPAPTSP